MHFCTFILFLLYCVSNLLYIFAWRTDCIDNFKCVQISRNKRKYSSTINMILDNSLFLSTNYNEYSMFPLYISNIDTQSILSTAFNKAKDGGIAGALAATIQVITLMWLRTTINFQYKYGGTTTEALQTLYKDGGISRFYQGLPFAIVNGPLSRFGDTASNSLVSSIFDSLDPTVLVYPLYIRTLLGSITAGIWRVFLMPIDTAKTCMQVDGPTALPKLYNRIRSEGIAVLYTGVFASSAATIAGHFPWFLTYNYLTIHVPTIQQFLTLPEKIEYTSGSSSGSALVLLLLSWLQSIDPLILDLSRSAFIGVCASSVSDITSNSFRVLKTTKQTMNTNINNDNSNNSNITTTASSTNNSLLVQTTYLSIAKDIIAIDGWQGLFGRGLQTRILANALQGMIFSIFFKYFQQQKT